MSLDTAFHLTPGFPPKICIRNCSCSKFYGSLQLSILSHRIRNNFERAKFFLLKNNQPRYLYVNIRPWPKDFEIADPWMAPPCGLATELIVLDLADMEVVGRWENLGFVEFYLTT